MRREVAAILAFMLSISKTAPSRCRDRRAGNERFTASEARGVGVSIVWAAGLTTRELCLSLYVLAFENGDVESHADLRGEHDIAFGRIAVRRARNAAGPLVCAP